MEGTTIGGWGVERVISNDGDVHVYAVARDGQRALVHVVAPGKSSTLLHAATAQRTLIVRGKHDGNAFVVTTDASPPRAKSKRTLVLAVIVLVLVAAGGAAAVALLRRTTTSPVCAACVLLVDGQPISTSSYRMYASAPYVFAARAGDDKKRAALDLLIVRAVLHAEAVRKTISVSLDDVASRARAADFALGLQTFDLRAKLADDGETFEDATIDRFAKSVGLANRQALFEEMRIERMAIAARAQDPAFDAKRACLSAKVVVDPRVATFLATPYQPCASLR